VRIAQIAPLFESVPPRMYGGTERVVSYLTDELVRMGHDVTLWASGDSQTLARLVAVRPVATRLDPTCSDPFASHILMIEQFAQRADEYDIAHFHIDYLHYPLLRRMTLPFVNTLHGRLDLAELQPLYREFSEVPVVSISDDQRRPLPLANWQGTVHHGLPRHLYSSNLGRRKPFLLFLGRISPEKGVDRAIRIAQKAGLPIKIAAKFDHAHKPYREYFENVIQPMLKNPGVEYLGEVNEAGKHQLLCDATGLLFPIDWPEPFGLVMAEAMACGTPVLAFRRGSVPEVIDDGVTGLIVDNEDEAVEAVGRLGTLDPVAIRATFERRFSARRMAEGYLAIYRKLAQPAARAPAARLNGFTTEAAFEPGIPAI
jgi:glycosyltransferase involved in cell wall biosynthesis